MPNRDAKRSKEDVGVGEALGRRKGRGGGRLRREALGQAVDLGAVEHGVGFQDRTSRPLSSSRFGPLSPASRIVVAPK